MAGRTRRTRKKGAMNAQGTKKWDGTKWVSVNVARDGQRATLNGKPVVRRGGNWVGQKKTSRGYRDTRQTTPTKTKETKTLKTIPAKDRPKDMQAGKVYGDAGQPKAPKLPPKPTATKAPVSTKASSPKKTTPKKTAPKKTESGPKLTPMQQWAKAHPELAKKVKKGQSGHKELKIGRSTKPRNWLEKNYKPGKK